MKSVTKENLEIVKHLPFQFEEVELDLDGWGNVDFYCKHNGILVLLEVEKTQKHPNTNVLKLWPFLEKHTEQKVLLLHVIRPENKAPKNRLNLCDFAGKKLEEIYPDRFKYFKYYWPGDMNYDIKIIEDKMEALKSNLM